VVVTAVASAPVVKSLRDPLRDYCVI